MKMGGAMPTMGWRRQEVTTGVLFVLPAVAGFVLLVIGPMAFSLYLSFTDWTMLKPPSWAGLDNWIRLPSDRLLVNSLLVTTKYTIAFVVINQVLSYLVALLLNQRLRAV